MRARELRAASTDAERALWRALRNRQLAGHKFRRQHPVGRYFADFVCVERRLVVELDGGQHYTPHGLESDRVRSGAIERLGYAIVRFSSREALTELDAVLAVLLARLCSSDPHPSPLPQAGEGVEMSPLPGVREEVKSLEPT